MVNLVSVLQLSYAEFIQCFPSPTCLAVLSLRPFEGKGILEFNPTLAFPIIEILLGGPGTGTPTIKREITEIEQSVLDGALRIILRDLREAWTSVANFGVPAIIIKMLRQKFDQRWSVRKSEPTGEEVMRMTTLATTSPMNVSAQLQGPTISVRNILRMQVGDVIAFDYPAARPIEVLLNGKPKFEAHLATVGNKKAVRLASDALRPTSSVLPKLAPGDGAPTSGTASLAQPTAAKSAPG